MFQGWARVAQGFTLRLAPPDTLGRRLQYALLSSRPDVLDVVDLDPTSGEARFPTVEDYLDLVRHAIALIAGLAQQPARRRRGAGGQAALDVEGVRVDCGSLPRGPSLYAAGKKKKLCGANLAGDYLLIAQTLECDAADLCPYVTSQGKRSMAWMHAAAVYAYKVLEAGKPLGGEVEDLPMLAKATLFGKSRVTGGGEKTEHKADKDTVGSILLGGAVAYLWAGRLGASSIEFLLVPDSPNRGYASLRNVMLQRGPNRGTVARAADMVSRLPVSFEVALSVALASDLAESYGDVRGMGELAQAEKLAESAVLIAVEPQQRPMVRSSILLSTVIYASYRRSTLRALERAYNAVASKLRGAAARLQGARDALGSCINSMYLQALHGRHADSLSSCIRSLEALAAQARREKISEVAESLERLVSELAGDYSRMLAVSRP